EKIIGGAGISGEALAEQAAGATLRHRQGLVPSPQEPPDDGRQRCAFAREDRAAQAAFDCARKAVRSTLGRGGSMRPSVKMQLHVGLAKRKNGGTGIRVPGINRGDGGLDLGL